MLHLNYVHRWKSSEYGWKQVKDTNENNISFNVRRIFFGLCLNKFRVTFLVNKIRKQVLYQPLWSTRIQVGKIPLNVAPHNSLEADKWQSCEIFFRLFFFSFFWFLLSVFLLLLKSFGRHHHHRIAYHSTQIVYSTVMYAIYQCVASKWLILSMSFEKSKWIPLRHTHSDIFDYLLRIR